MAKKIHVHKKDELYTPSKMVTTNRGTPWCMQVNGNIDGVGGQRHAPAALLQGKRRVTHFIGGWVGPRAAMEGAEYLANTGIRSPDRPGRSQSICRLRNPGPPYEYNKLQNVVQKPIIKSCLLRFLAGEINNRNSVFIPKQNVLEKQRIIYNNSVTRTSINSRNLKPASLSQHLSFIC